jgi:hypothetical protein
VPGNLKVHTDRLAKLFRLMMAATSAGEVVNARDGIVRILKTEHQDIHDLANVLLLGLQPPPPPVVVASPSVDASACDIAAWCIVQLKLNPKLPCEPREREFLDDMSQRWGEPTDRQAKWLSAIHNRLIRLGARHA